MKKEGIFKTFKFYNSKKQRIGVFGKDNGDGILKLVIFRCSTKDHFSKKQAREAFELYDEGKITDYYHPQRIDVRIENGDSAGWTFINFCHENYYRKQSILTFVEEEIFVNLNHPNIIYSNKLSKSIRDNYGSEG